MATSSFFKPFVVRPEDEASWIKVFESKKKFKKSNNYTHKKLNKEEALIALHKMMRNQ